MSRGRAASVPYLSLACCALALLLTFVRLIEFDAPLTRFVRSLNDFQIDHLHNPWLAQLSDVGDEVGKGESLLLVNAVLLAAGYTLGRASLKRAGWETLIAHLVAGGINTAIKHVVGRGRPKFMHTGNSEFSPFGGAGWDSFPSGHSMATFAVAAVLAVRFPKVRWLVILWALIVSVSRLFRASHFLTDIVAGAVLGVLIGAVVAHPWEDRFASFTSALMTVTPPLAVVLALMTTIGQSPISGKDRHLPESKRIADSLGGNDRLCLAQSATRRAARLSDDHGSRRVDRTWHCTVFRIPVGGDGHLAGVVRLLAEHGFPRPSDQSRLSPPMAL